MMATMVDDLRSGRFDLLLTGYSDRWQRNLRRTLELLEDELHPNGVALVMCDRKILSSDPSDWDELISEAAGAEKYSRRLSERITEGYAAKFDQERDPGGHAGLGFRRLSEPPHTLEIDLDRMPIVVGLFERYALGNVSATQLEAETDLAATRIRMILMNPLYNGWIRRHRGKNETRRPAPWRATPPVSDELWARVEEVRRSKTRGRGPKNWDRPDLLGGLLECVCGRQLRNDGTFADGRHRKLHASPCEAWGPQGPPRRPDMGSASASPGRRLRGGRRHPRIGRCCPRVKTPAGRDRPGTDRPADP
jgi:DNA invertase Pin-like site-specific DNA recombinase